MPSGKVFSTELIESRPGLIVFRVDGKGSNQAFCNEGGLHQIQRIPPTEKRGRVQTSTITVAVMPEVPIHQIKIDHNDLEWKFSRCGGPGGQSVNTTDSAVQLTYLPNNLQVRCVSERSQKQNKEIALQILFAKLEQASLEKHANDYNNQRREQVGSGNRGDKKVRTVRFQDDLVIDHVTGKKMTVKKYIKGEIEALH